MGAVRGASYRDTVSSATPPYSDLEVPVEIEFGIAIGSFPWSPTMRLSSSSIWPSSSAVPPVASPSRAPPFPPPAPDSDLLRDRSSGTGLAAAAAVGLSLLDAEEEGGRASTGGSDRSSLPEDSLSGNRIGARQTAQVSALRPPTCCHCYRHGAHIACPHCNASKISGSAESHTGHRTDKSSEAVESALRCRSGRDACASIDSSIGSLLASNR